MTANEMADEWEFSFDKITNSDSPGYEDTEISAVLNKAQERFVLQNIAGRNKTGEASEETEKSRKDISELITNAEITTASSTQTGVVPNGVLYDLPSDFLYAIKEEVTISSSDTCVNGNRIRVKPITHDNYAIDIVNPFKQPYDELVWRLDYSRVTAGTGSRRHELITDGTYTISTYHLRYYKTLPDIVVNRSSTTSAVDCVLNDITHRRIIDMAVEIALEATVDGRLQTNLLLNQTNE